MSEPVDHGWRERITARLCERYVQSGRPALLSRDTYDMLAELGVDLRYARMLEHGAPHQPGAMP